MNTLNLDVDFALIIPVFCLHLDLLLPSHSFSLSFFLSFFLSFSLFLHNYGVTLISCCGSPLDGEHINSDMKPEECR